MYQRGFFPELKSDEELYHSTDSLLTEYWPPYKRLIEEAREEWLAGSLLWNCLPQKPMRSTWLRKAAVSFATATEIELRCKVFDRFRGYVRGKQERVSSAQEALGSPTTKVFADFLVKDRPLTLMQMGNLVDDCRRSRDRLLKLLGDWLRENHLGLTNRSLLVREIGAFRNPAQHRGVSTATVDSIHGWCREVIESLGR